MTLKTDHYQKLLQMAKEQGNRKHERGQAYKRVLIVRQHRPFKQNATISNIFKTQLDSD